jgi:hypothetical protein
VVTYVASFTGSPWYLFSQKHAVGVVALVVSHPAIRTSVQVFLLHFVPHMGPARGDFYSFFPRNHGCFPYIFSREWDLRVALRSILSRKPVLRLAESLFPFGTPFP